MGNLGVLAVLLIIPSLFCLAQSTPPRKHVTVVRCEGLDDTKTLTTATTAATGGTIIIEDTCAGRDVVFPSTVALRIERGGLLKPLNGHTIDITGPFSAGQEAPYQVFTNALSGQGTIRFVGNRFVSTFYPQWWGAVGTGTIDDSPAVQAAVSAIRDLGKGRLEFGAGNYRFNSTVVLEAGPADILNPIVFSGYNATITVSTPGTAGFEIKNAIASRAFLYWIIEGFKFIGTGSESDIIKVTNVGASYTYHWQIRDVIIQGSGGHGIHVDSSKAKPGHGAFEFTIANCNIDLGESNTTKFGIFLDGPPGTISSAELLHNNVAHGKNGVRGNSASLHVEGGTVLSATEEGIFAVVQSGLFAGVHLEANWRNALPGTGGGQLFIEGWADVIGLEEWRGPTAGARWAIDIYSWGGPTNIIGRRYGSTSPRLAYVRVRNALNKDLKNGNGVINLMGIGPGEVDASATVSPDAPYINILGAMGSEAIRTGAGSATFGGGVQIGSSGQKIVESQSRTALMNFTALAAQTCEESTISGYVNLAATDVVNLGVPDMAASDKAALTNTTFVGFVSNSSTVTVRRCNIGTTTSFKPGTQRVRATVWRY